MNAKHSSSSDAAQSRQQFERLLVGLIDDSLSPAEQTQLSDMLQASAELRELYVSHVLTETLLKWSLADVNDTAQNLGLPVAAPAENVLRGSTKFVRRGIWTAAGLLFCLGLFLFSPSDQPQRITKQEQKTVAPAVATADAKSAAEFVAVLIDSEDAVWAAADQQFEYGTAFPRGTLLELKSGLIRLAFDCGAGVVLEGPARLELCTAWKAQLHRGKLAAVVPEEAQGFTVLTPEMRIVDLGTKFSTEVNDSGAASVQVYEGEVTVQPRTGPAENEALLLSSQSRSRFSQIHTEPPGIAVMGVDSNELVSVPSFEQLRLACAGQYPPLVRTVPLIANLSVQPSLVSPQKIDIPEQVWLAETFHPVPSSNSQKGSQHPWIVDGKFARVISLEKPLQWQSICGDGYAVELDGRDPAFPSLCHRLETRLPQPLTEDFYFSFLGRYQGLDANDFFALWFDNSRGIGISHSAAPNAGIRFGEYFARLKLERLTTSPVESGDVSFFLVGKLQKGSQGKYSLLSLWINPLPSDLGEPDLQVALPPQEGLPRVSTLGVRMGQETELDDKLWLDRLLIGFHLADVLGGQAATRSGLEIPADSSTRLNNP